MLTLRGRGLGIPREAKHMINKRSICCHALGSLSVFYSAFLLFPTGVLCEDNLMYKEDILCMGVEKKNHASAVCLACNLLW